MLLRSPFFVASIACAALAPAAFSTTWIVDQANGPGTHFTDLPPAIAAAASGDSLIVRAGSYSPFLLEKGLTLLGESSGTTKVFWGPGMSTRIRNVPAGEIVIVAEMSFLSTSSHLDVSHCAGAVVFDHVYGAINVLQCADVRIASLDNYGGVSVRDSHVEIVSSDLVGETEYDGIPGGSGVYIAGASRVLFARSSATGGDGGDAPPFEPGGAGGYGGAGASVLDFSELLIAGGGTATLRGGYGGQGTLGGPNGYPGSGLFNHASRDWRSGATFIGAAFAPPIFYIPGPGSFDTAVTPDDPTIELVGTPHPGAIVELNTYSIPGSIVRMTLGGTPVVIPVPGIRVEQLTTRDRSVFLGVVPASGKVTHLLKVPAGYPIGAKLFAQSRVTDPSFGEVRRTNSVPIIVR